MLTGKTNEMKLHPESTICLGTGFAVMADAALGHWTCIPNHIPLSFALFYRLESDN